jgi:methylenetetrahydrofolate dehydrogenase (NADP+)/methenyltetrahydrofolate cyclohydrolase
MKQKFAQSIGAEVQLVHFADSVSSNKIIEAVKRLNSDAKIHGIIVQLPLPTHFSPEEKELVVQTVAPAKDVDGLVTGSAFTPATARGILELLSFYEIAVRDKKVTVVGRSALVGKPTAELLTKNSAHVTVGHSKTPDLSVITKPADIIISAVGRPSLITANHVRPGQVIVDVGTTPVGGKLRGDVDFDAVAEVIGPEGAISPVPGGVGPMTVLALFENLIDAWSLHLM